jgi:hypothetical protein
MKISQLNRTKLILKNKIKKNNWEGKNKTKHCSNK